jgi:hypothetical protein
MIPPTLKEGHTLPPRRVGEIADRISQASTREVGRWEELDTVDFHAHILVKAKDAERVREQLKKLCDEFPFSEVTEKSKKFTAKKKQ